MTRTVPAFTSLPWATFLRAAVIVLALATVGGCKPSKNTEPLRVAAAADLTLAFTELAADFTKRTGLEVTVTYGSTGQLAKQLSQGAPFEVFAAADVATVDALAAAGTCIASTKSVFARGRLVVWTAPGITAPSTLEELTDERFKRIAIANTEHAPYGRAAKAALAAAGAYGNVKARLVFGDSVSQALQLVRSGNAEAGLIARSLIMSSKDGQMLLIDDSLHPPLNQAAIVCGTDGPQREAARAFLDAVNASTSLFEKFGFELPAQTAQ